VGKPSGTGGVNGGSVVKHWCEGEEIRWGLEREGNSYVKTDKII